MTTFDDRINAIKTINSNAVSFFEDKIFDNNGNEISISETDITNKIAELKTAYDNLEYQRKRAADYPTIQDQLDMQYWDSINGTTTWKDAIKTTKDKYAKE